MKIYSIVMMPMLTAASACGKTKSPEASDKHTDDHHVAGAAIIVLGSR